jgi:hypothetical protein
MKLVTAYVKYKNLIIIIQQPENICVFNIHNKIVPFRLFQTKLKIHSKLNIFSLYLNIMVKLLKNLIIYKQ